MSHSNSNEKHESHQSYAEQAEEARQDANREQAELLREAWSEAAGHELPESGEAAASPMVDEALNAQIAELKDQLLRSVAETENVRRRAQRDIEDAGKYAITNFAREIVGICDNLTRAADAIPAQARQGNDLLATIAQGVDMTLRELMNVLERFQITRIAPIGKPFDHNLHQAVVQIEHPEAEPGTVLQVMQAGYTLHGRLLRPAMVGVAKRPETPPADVHLDTKA